MMANKVVEHITSVPKGTILFLSDLLTLNGDNKAVSRILSVEQKRGALVRLANGIYLVPRHTKFGVLYPPVDEIVRAIARRDNAQVLPCGASALNRLGLSTQVPMTYTYVTTGSARNLVVGNRKIELKRSVPRNFAYKTSLMPLLVQALKVLGQENIGSEEVSVIAKLIAQEQNRDALSKDLLMVPAWMKKLLTPLINETHNEKVD